LLPALVARLGEAHGFPTRPSGGTFGLADIAIWAGAFRPIARRYGSLDASAHGALRSSKVTNRHFYSITSSATVSRRSGTRTPRGFAVLRLSTSTNLLACSIGRTAGFSPPRILAA